MNKVVFILFAFLFISFQNESRACLNGYQIIPGIEKYDQEEYDIEMIEVYFEELQDYKNTAIKDCASSLKKECVDLVIALLYLKDYSKALVYAQKLYAKFPNEYNVVITYAATLELNGKLDYALQYINVAMKINPDSHRGSEWMHVKIIEDLLGFNKNDFSVVGLDFGNDSIPFLEGKSKTELWNLLVQCAFQISERKYFISRNDKAFGKLIFDYANLLQVNNFISISEQYYEMAARYGFNNDLVAKRTEYVKKWKEKKYNRPVEDEPSTQKKKVKNQKRFNWKGILKITIPLFTFLVIVIIIWYRNKLYRSHWKK